MSKYEIGLEAFINQYASVPDQTFIEHIREHGVFKLGHFTLKSGLLSPIYIDFRGLISSQQLMNETSYMVCQLINAKAIQYDYVLGVPYAALSLGSRVSLFVNKPLLMNRKEAKTYGTKKKVEGVYEQNGRALIIEDVVTTGGSILETVEDLRNEGLVVEDVICVLDREQGGAERLLTKGIRLHSVLKVSQILQYLLDVKYINDEQLAEIREALANPKRAPVQNGFSDAGPQWSLSARASLLERSQLNARLLKTMKEKQSNLCVAIDVKEAKEVLELVKQIQSNVCAVKLHADGLNGADTQFFNELRQLAQSGNFVLFEDRKFADIGNTNYLQLVNGPHKIAEWADLITVHSLPGPASIKCFEPAINDSSRAIGGALLVAELSSEDTLTSEGSYTQKTVEMAKKCPSVVSGFICQKRCADDPAFLYWTPGVHLEQTGDGQGQKWRGVEDAVQRDGNDIIIVGRGITGAMNPQSEAARYQQAGWKAIQTREQ